MHPHKHSIARWQRIVWLGLSVILKTSCTSTAFQLPKIPCKYNRNPHLLQSHEIMRRFASERNNNNDSSDSGGRDLAKQFAAEIQKRKGSQSSYKDETYELLPNNNDDDSSKKPIPKKFTGASSTTSLFTRNQNTTPSTNIQNERQREFNLASNFERYFPLQAAVLLAWGVFIAVIGLSGGIISDGSSRYFYGDDDLIEDAVVEQLERIRTDDSAQEFVVRGSTWL